MIKWANALVASVLLIHGSAAGHAQTVNATISGIATDPSSAVLPGVAVTVRNIGIDSTRVTVTDQVGRYTITGLAPGVYQIRAELAGFQTAVRTDVVASVAGASVVDFRMELGTLLSELNVV